MWNEGKGARKSDLRKRIDSTVNTLIHGVGSGRRVLSSRRTGRGCVLPTENSVPIRRRGTWWDAVPTDDGTRLAVAGSCSRGLLDVELAAVGSAAASSSAAPLDQEAPQRRSFLSTGPTSQFRCWALAGCPAAPQEAPLAGGCAALPLRPCARVVRVRRRGCAWRRRQRPAAGSFPGWGRWWA